MADQLARRNFIYLVVALALLGKVNWFLWMGAVGAPLYFLALAAFSLKNSPAARQQKAADSEALKSARYPGHGICGKLTSPGPGKIYFRNAHFAHSDRCPSTPRLTTQPHFPILTHKNVISARNCGERPQDAKSNS
jgi:hypothetical protein